MKNELRLEEISVAICDDEARWRKDIITLCEAYSKEHLLKFNYAEFTCGQEVLKNKGCGFDILFLDVEMEDMNGIEVKNKLQFERCNAQIIFITSHKEAIQDAFGRNVFGFVTKPIEKELLYARLDLVIDYMLDERKTIMLNQNGKIRLLYLKDVVYIEADGRYSKIYTVNSSDYNFSDKNIGFWREYLEVNGFEMSMRSILVNMAYVDRIGQNIVRTTTGKDLELSRRMKRKFSEAYREYIWKKGC